MLKTQRLGLLPVLILLITFIAADQSGIKILNTTIVWIIDFLTIICVLRYKKLYFRPVNPKDYRIVYLYFIWMLIGVVRGIFVPENYWEWKNLIANSMALSIPICVYVFSIPDILQKTLRLWVKIAIPAFFLFFVWVLIPGAYHFYLGPALLIACFLPILPKERKLIFLGLILLMIFISFADRSQVIKAAIALLISIAYLISKYMTPRVLKLMHLFWYIVPIVLLVLGVAGIFNLFEVMTEKEGGKYYAKEQVDGQIVDSDLAADTRTFIYYEVIGSAVQHRYILQGRTPARGNDSEIFGTHFAEELKTGKYERSGNEIGLTTVFTWLGLIGLILYSLLYLKSSYLAVYKSNNIWIKLLGVYIAFRWAYGWVEDPMGFNIRNLSLWMMIAMGFSEQFRKMTNLEFKQWVHKIFK